MQTSSNRIEIATNDGPLIIDLVEVDNAIEIRTRGTKKLLIKPMASNAIEIRGSKY